jgi:hypothetical protein
VSPFQEGKSEEKGEATSAPARWFEADPNVFRACFSPSEVGTAK